MRHSRLLRESAEARRLHADLVGLDQLVQRLIEGLQATARALLHCLLGLATFAGTYDLGDGRCID
jgi:hypothetical protein